MRILAIAFCAAVAAGQTAGPETLFEAARTGDRARVVQLVDSGVDVNAATRYGVTALGFAAGITFHTTLAALGVAALLRSSPVAFEVIKLAGAAYLIWIGIKALRSQGLATAHERPPQPLMAVFRQSVLGNLLNPKVTLFFVVYLPQFVQPHGTQSVTLQMLYVGDRLDTNNQILDEYILLNLMANAQLTDRVEAVMRLENLTDQFYEEVRGFGTPGFAARLEAWVLRQPFMWSGWYQMPGEPTAAEGARLAG